MMIGLEEVYNIFFESTLKNFCRPCFEENEKYNSCHIRPNMHYPNFLPMGFSYLNISIENRLGFKV